MARPKKTETAPTKTAKPKLVVVKTEKVKAPKANGESASIVPLAMRQKYAETNNSCGDAFAEALAAAVQSPKGEKSKKNVLDLGKLEQVATSNGIDFGKFSHLNPGQQRMNVGNVLRGKAYAGEVVTIGGTTFDLTAAIKKARAKTKSDVLDDYDIDSLLEQAGFSFSKRGHNAVEAIFKSLNK